jgi:hypothetical protein
VQVAANKVSGQLLLTRIKAESEEEMIKRAIEESVRAHQNHQAMMMG